MNIFSHIQYNGKHVIDTQILTAHERKGEAEGMRRTGSTTFCIKQLINNCFIPHPYVWSKPCLQSTHQKYKINLLHKHAHACFVYTQCFKKMCNFNSP